MSTQMLQPIPAPLAVTGNQGALGLRTYQAYDVAMKARILYHVWRRQSGKSYTIGAKCLHRMLTRSNHSCFVVSASIATGKEVLEKEAMLWHKAIEVMKRAAEQAQCKLGGNVIDKGTRQILSVDDLADLLEKNATQIKIHHSRTSYSRTMIIAPNADTCRGWTGDIFGDEIGFWPDFDAIWDGVEPFISSNPEYLLWLYTTPPKNDTHPTFELLNPAGLEFTPNALGNFYHTEAGYLVHRLDAYDSALAGVPMYHPLTSEPCDYDTYRLAAQDKVSADRNYLLRFTTGGCSAIAKAHMDRAIDLGRGRCVAYDLCGDDLSPDAVLQRVGKAWAEGLQAGNGCALGLDMASTTKKMSNPSALTLLQELNGKFYERLTIRFKTGEMAELEQLLAAIIAQIPSYQLRGLAVDTSNEKFAGSHLKDVLHCRVVGYSGGENVKLLGKKVQAKYAMGSCYVAAYESVMLGVAPDAWLAQDRRNMMREGDRFDAPVTKEGYHSDTFDSGKLALWELVYAKNNRNMFAPIAV